MKAKFLLLPLMLAPALGACTDTQSGDAHVNGNLHLAFGSSGLTLTAQGHPDAHVGADGALRIGDKAVALTPAQRDLLRRYYGEAVSMRDDGIATGKAGAALGISAATDSLESLFSDGSKKQSDPEMEADSKKVDAAAHRLCADMLQIKSTQSDIAAQLPAMAPYAVFRGEVRCDEKASASGANVGRDQARDKIRDKARDVLRHFAG